MALMIREIGVRMAVRGPDQTGAPLAPTNPKPAAGMSSTERDALVSECVRVVLETLQRQEAR